MEADAPGRLWRPGASLVCFPAMKRVFAIIVVTLLALGMVGLFFPLLLASTR